MDGQGKLGVGLGGTSGMGGGEMMGVGGQGTLGWDGGDGGGGKWGMMEVGEGHQGWVDGG